MLMYVDEAFTRNSIDLELVVVVGAIFSGSMVSWAVW